MMPKGFAAAALFTLLSGATVGYYSVPSLAQQSGGANTPNDTKHADWPTAPNGTAVQPENNPKYPGDSPSRDAVTTKDDMDAESFRPTGGEKEEGGSATVTQEPIENSTPSTDVSTQTDTTVDNSVQDESTVDQSVQPSTEVAPDTTTSTDTSTMDNSYDQTTSTSAAPQDTSTDTSADTSAPAPRRARAHRHHRME